MKRIIVLILAAALLAFAYSCKSSDTAAPSDNTTDPSSGPAMPNDGVYDTFDNLVENNLKADDGTVIIRAICAVPSVEHEDPEICEKINSALKKKAADFVSGADSLRVLAEDNYASFADNAESFQPYSLMGTYEITLLDEKYLSVLFSFSEAIGGFHANESIYGMTFRLSDGATVDLDEVFDSDEESVRSYVSGRFEELIKAAPDNYYGDAVEAVGSYVDMSRFYLTEDGISIFLPVYAIAPYSTGMPEISISYGELSEFVQNRS